MIHENTAKKKEKEIKKQLDVPSMHYIRLFSSRISMCRRLIVNPGLMMMIEFKFLLKYYSEAQLLPKKSPHWTASLLLLVPHSWAIILMPWVPSRALKWASFGNNVVNIPKKENNFKLHNILLLYLPLIQFQWDLSSHFLYAFASEFRVGNNGGEEKRSWGLIKIFPVEYVALNESSEWENKTRKNMKLCVRSL